MSYPVMSGKIVTYNHKESQFGDPTLRWYGKVQAGLQTFI